MNISLTVANQHLTEWLQEQTLFLIILFIRHIFVKTKQSVALRETNKQTKKKKQTNNNDKNPNQPTQNKQTKKQTTEHTSDNLYSLKFL